MNIIPSGWKDDGHTLTAPNGVAVVLGFREYVLSHNWEPANYPVTKEYGTSTLEGSNPGLGGGTQQVFRFCMLEYPTAPDAANASLKDTVVVSYIGDELLYARLQWAKYSALAKGGQSAAYAAAVHVIRGALAPLP